MPCKLNIFVIKPAELCYLYLRVVLQFDGGALQPGVHPGEDQGEPETLGRRGVCLQG